MPANGSACRRASASGSDATGTISRSWPRDGTLAGIGSPPVSARTRCFSANFAHSAFVIFFTRDYKRFVQATQDNLNSTQKRKGAQEILLAALRLCAIFLAISPFCAAEDAVDRAGKKFIGS